MPKQIIIAEQHKTAAIFSEEQIQELVVATGSQQVGDISVGTVENIIPGIDAAFVNIGDAERNGFIHVSDLGPLRLRRSASAITELLAPQQKVLVQVMKEPTGNKGPRLTGNVSLPGRYLVLMPYGRGVNLSRRIMNETERSRLRALAILVKPAGMGLLVRTEAEGQAEDAIIEDLEYLKKQWESVQQQANAAKPPCLLNRDDDFIKRVLRDIYSADVNRIVVDSSAGVKRVKDHLRNWSGDRTAPDGLSIDHHRERVSILEYFRVNAAIREALKPRVDLPSGGYIIIEPTEALTVVDVNSGSFTRSATSRETVLWTNYEAATEIARQLRLRNIGGVIVVDFIDMDSRRDKIALLDHFNQSLRGDKARPQIAQLSELGLVELTRKRQGQNLYELFAQECPSCGGLGHVCQLPGESGIETLDKQPSNIASTSYSKFPEKRVSPFRTPFEPQSNDSARNLDLVNHPSYQEPTSGNGNRRRRRRRGESDALNNVSTAPSTPTKTKPRAAANGQRHDVPLPESPAREASSPMLESASGSRYSSSRSPRREAIPVETVEVEMTPMEQNVYALMGISPLIRAECEVKDPKSVMVSVVTTGTSQSVGSSSTTEPPPRRAVTRPPALVEEMLPVPDILPPLEELPPVSTAPAESKREVRAAISLPVVPIDSEESHSTAQPVTRRRRRRSSSLKE
ncbi:MAG: ribonuclease E/G [Spirulina sp. SIO3F2]|nr:ribonuclease E/G [Spirulina sp. SIO3F2]